MTPIHADQFEFVRHLGTGNFGVCQCMVDQTDGELVAVKFLERGPKIDRNVEREILVHSTLHSPFIIGFKKYAAGGELFAAVQEKHYFQEDIARYFFQQLIVGVQYCHERHVAHRDLKLENTLLDGSPAPVLKIADFGYCKDLMASTPPRSIVGTPAYISPEVLQCHNERSTYDGKAADVWSCGVHLYVMLVGAYPFDDPRQPAPDMASTMRNVIEARYAWPRNINLSESVKDLVFKIFEPEASRRITIPEIQQHPWFLTNLPWELQNGGHGLECYRRCTQPEAEIVQVLRAARHA